MGDVTREMDALAFEGDDLREALRKEHARAAELERELETLCAAGLEVERALAAREAENVETRAAVESKLAEYERDDAEWRALKGLGDLPHDSALVEDWKAILAILSRAPGSSDALREFAIRVWDAACDSVQKVERAYASGQMWLVTKEDTRAADIARLLGDARGEEGAKG